MRKSHLWTVTALLLLVALSRVFRLDVSVTELRVDEMWSIWQGFGPPESILRWTPYDWPPLYYLLLAGWRVIGGLHPVTLRWLSVLLFMLGTAAMYRVGKRWGGHRAGVGSLLAYAALGYLIFLSTELRGYALMLALFPLTLWAMLHYFDRPGVRRALPLAMGMAAMFYTTLTSVGALAVLGLVSLILYRAQIWRWWLPGGMAAGLALPEIINKVQIGARRLDAVSGIELPPVVESLRDLYAAYFGPWGSLPLLIGLVAFIGVLIYRRQRAGRVGVVLFVWVLLPLVLYVANNWLGFFQPRYAWWVMPGLALAVGWTLAHVPRPAWAAGSLVLAGLMFAPLPLLEYQIFGPPLGKTFVWLRDHIQPGDVLLIDPSCDTCGGLESYDVLTRMYFPGGLDYVQTPGSARRVWFVSGEAPDPTLQTDVEAGRVMGEFFGPSYAKFQLYEGPPDTGVTLFENGMRLDGFELVGTPSPLVLHEGESLNVRLWWSVETPPTLDYSVGLYLLDDAGQVVMQDDHAPRVTDQPAETSQWTAGEVYIDERTLILPYPTPDGTYQLAVVVYFWENNERVRAPGANADLVLPLARIVVQAW